MKALILLSRYLVEWKAAFVLLCQLNIPSTALIVKNFPCCLSNSISIVSWKLSCTVTSLPSHHRVSFGRAAVAWIARAMSCKSPLPPLVNMFQLRHPHIPVSEGCLEDVAFLCRSWCDSLEVGEMSGDDDICSQYLAFTFCVTDAISSGPVEDTDTTNFVAQLVSTFYLFIQSRVWPVSSLVCFVLISHCSSVESLAVICKEMYHNWTDCAVIAKAPGLIEGQVVAGCSLSLHTR